MLKHLQFFQLVVGLFLLITAPAIAQEQNPLNEWPREITTSHGNVIIYQPQPESLTGNLLKGRAAVALEMKNQSEPIFGAFWFEAKLSTDRSERTATITDIKVTDVRFPNRDNKKSQQFINLLETEMPKWQLVISMDRLLATLELAENKLKASEKIATNPPAIIFIPEPAILVYIDGEPRLQQEKGSKLMRVVNTAFTILLNPDDKTYYLNADVKTWYKSSDLKGNWTIADKVPQAVASLAPKPGDETVKAPNKTKEKPGPAPKIIVATAPTELISSTGKPEYTPVPSTELLYMSNSDSDVLMHITDQKYYILLAGRWYTSSKLDGPWKYTPGDKLPADFAKIPEDSDMSTVLYAVPGTKMAKDAILDAQLPQTAKVDRKKADLIVKYDGKPKFEPIKKTSMTYAVNSVTPVILLNKKYYACDNGIWFVADSPTGKWLVATSIPAEIYTIPAESPLYNVTFVYIYSSTPEVVYVGYTPGYTNTYIYYNTVVYGTGYYYPYWYGTYYYPRPATWGFCVRYSSYGGWRFGFSYSTGPYNFYFGRGWYGGGWWGPGRHRAYRHGYNHGYRHGYNRGARAGYRAGTRNANRNNIYRNQHNKNRTMASSTPARRSQARGTANRPNNIYADKQGNVHRNNGQSWEQKTNKGWISTQPSGQTKNNSVASRPSKNNATSSNIKPVSRLQTKPASRPTNVDRSYQARQHGSQRNSSYQRSGGSRPTSGRRSGGGGKRR